MKNKEKRELTAEEFIREKIKEKYELRGDVNALWKYEVSGEDAMRWAQEFRLLATLPEENEEKNINRVSLANAQFIGFKEGKWNGDNIISLVIGMNLTVSEWEELKEYYPIDLDDYDVDAIEEYFNPSK